MRPSHVLGMLLGLSFTAARTAAQAPDAGKEPAKAAAVDLYGDPLPPGIFDFVLRPPSFAGFCVPIT